MNKLLLIMAIVFFTVNKNFAQSKRSAEWETENPVVETAGTSPPTYAEIQPVLVKSTCTACHEAEKRKVGPPFKAIAKRKYTTEEIINLIYKPKPEHWPEYVAPMPPMLHVPKEDAERIAKWINSLSETDES